MKALLIIVCLALLAISANSQQVTDKQMNFVCIDNAMVWEKNYTSRPASLLEGTLGIAFLKESREVNGKVFCDLVDFSHKPSGEQYSGRVIIAPDSTGYKVTIRGMTMKFGSTRSAQMQAIGGMKVDNAIQLDGTYTKDGRFATNYVRKQLTLLDEKFVALFEFK